MMKKKHPPSSSRSQSLSARRPPRPESPAPTVAEGEASEAGPRKGGLKETGDLYYGLNTCLALWGQQADGIKRLFVSEDRLKKVSKILKWCAQRKRPYHVVTPDDLAKITKSVHHEGIAMLVEPQFPMDEEGFFQWLTKEEAEPRGTVQKKKPPLLILYLDGVKNPHNLGSVVRTAAHFGIPVILGRMGELPRLSPSAARVAEGGMLAVKCVALKNPRESLEVLRKKHGFELVGTQSALSEGEGGSSPAAKASQKITGELGSLFAKPFSSRSVLFLGNEVTGMSPEIRSLADRNVFIPGSGNVESLNVAVAAGIFFGEFWRLYGQKNH